MVTVQVEQSAEGSTGEWDETEMADVQVSQDVDECSRAVPVVVAAVSTQKEVTFVLVRLVTRVVHRAGVELRPRRVP